MTFLLLVAFWLMSRVAETAAMRDVLAIFLNRPGQSAPLRGRVRL